MKAALFLILVTLMWGTTFPLQKFVLADFSPFVFNAMRFWLAAFFSLFFTKRHVFKEGILLGLVLGAAYLTQTWGITLTTASKSGFLTSLYIVIVPFFAFLIEKEKVNGLQKLAFPIAVVGSYLLSGGIKGLNAGDLLNILCGVFFALHMIMITRYSKKYDEMSLITIQFILAALINTIAGIGSDWTPSVMIMGSAVYMALFPALIAVVLQLKYQKKLGNNITVLIFVGEPVFSTIFAIAFLKESLSLMQSMGAGFMVVALTLAGLEIRRSRKKAYT